MDARVRTACMGKTANWRIAGRRAKATSHGFERQWPCQRFFDGGGHGWSGIAWGWDPCGTTRGARGPAARVAGPGNRVQVGRPRRPKAERHTGMGILAVFGGSGQGCSGPPMICLSASGWDRGKAWGPHKGLGLAKRGAGGCGDRAWRTDAPRERNRHSRRKLSWV